MRKSILVKALASVFIGTAALTACVDDKYDLDNLDATIQVGKDGKLTIPGSSTGTITLKSLFDIDDGSAIKDVNGSYFVEADGKATSNNIKVNVISIKKPTDKQFHASLDFRAPGSVKKFATSRAPGLSYIYDISALASANIENAETSSPISSDLVSISHIGFGQTKYTLDVTISGTNKDIIDQFHFENLAIHMPTGLEVSSCKYMGNEVLTTDALKKKAHDDGEIAIPNFAYSTTSATPLTFEITLESADITTTNKSTIYDNATNACFNSDTHMAKLGGRIYLEGYASITSDDLNQTVLTTKFTAASISTAVRTAIAADMAAGDYNSVLNLLLPNLDFDGSGKFNNNLQVDKFTGVIEHTVDLGSDTEITLNDLPDFLKEDDVDLDLQNPQVFLKLSVKKDASDATAKDFNENIFTNGIIIEAYKENETNPSQLDFIADASTGPITFSKTAGEDVIVKYIYSNLAPGEEPTIPTEYEDYAAAIKNTANWIRPHILMADGTTIPTLPELLRKVPNVVKIKGVDAVGNKTNSIKVTVNCNGVELPQNNTIGFDYMVYTPLAFGKDFKIVYKETENDWAKDMDDLKDMNFGALEVEADVCTTDPIPLDFTLTIVPIDQAGKSLADIITVTPVKISKLSATTSQHIKLTLQPTSGKTFRDVFKGTYSNRKLDGIEMRATMDNPDPTQSLKSTQNIFMKNLKLTLVGGVTYYDE